MLYDNISLSIICTKYYKQGIYFILFHKTKQILRYWHHKPIRHS